ncbi:hypothetical protein BDQ94DRAFT_132680 [Aspergillus welwitschiae]|uniref:Uncharacterized protein n=1 Tax=Aspergillus welwitschiae TaxID=1341132 RepID=A0A3F3QK43_9EURO|nr:hypothetical protein BDQ94DRAFT_132680 [Aspergillus welwitschiae]RDH39222.1 hypothetical protein BDQ94DRAFT_132680 [Aspergillus welwitschiae]
MAHNTTHNCFLIGPLLVAMMEMAENDSLINTNLLLFPWYMSIFCLLVSNAELR